MASRLRTRLRASTGLATPSLNIELATAAGGLDPRVTFSRGSNATLTDSTGKITYAPNNLLTNSESFEASSWLKSGATITSNSLAAPNGTSTADTLVEDTSTGDHVAYQTLTFVAGVNYIMTVYAKANTRTRLNIVCVTGLLVQANFDLSAGTVISTISGTASISDAGNGWYRCVLAGTATSTASGNMQLRLISSGTTTSYTGNGTSGLFIWGAQLEAVTYQTTPGTYNSTTPKNLLGYTQEFDNAAWTKADTTITANSTAAPDGTMTADTLVAAATTAAHTIRQTGGGSGSPHTLSIYAKAGTSNFIQLYHASISTIYANFNVAAGTVGTVGAGATAAITSVGNGWYRCSITFTPGSVSTSRVAMITSATAVYAESWTAAGTETIFIWGAQLSNSASLDPYVYNPDAAPTSAAYYGPRFDYDPVTLAPKGLLIEEQRTNLLTYSEQFDNAAWAKTNATVTANSATAPDGTSTADSLIENTANGVHDARRTVTASALTTYTQSIFVKASGRTRGQMQIFGNSGGSTVNYDLTAGTATAVGTYGGWTGASATITNFGNGWYRITNTATTNAGLTALVAAYLLADASGSGSYTGDGTSGMLYWGAQVEVGAFATSYIPTVASTVTRSGDVAQMLGDNFTSWYNQSEGTFVAFADTLKPSGFAQTANLNSANDGTSSNAVSLRFGTSNATGLVQTGGTAQTGFAGTAYTANTPVKWGMAYQLNNTALCVAGGSATTDTSVTVGLTMTQMNIGARNGALDPLNGHIQSIQYYPTRLTDTQLQVLST